MEWLHYLTLPAPIAHRRLGYVTESVSLLARSRRCRRAWRPHCDAARSAVSDVVAALPLRRDAVVLGSGLLDDVPLGQLAAAFGAVRLVDAVHPWRTRMAARAHGNVTLVEADLGGTAGWLLGTSPIVDPLPALCAGGGVDLVVSANLLSQLPILPVDRLERRGDPAARPLGGRIVAAHLEALARLPARTCLVTDVEQVEYDRAGRVTDRTDLLHGIGMPEPDRAWDWEVAPFGEAARDRRLVHRVHAYLDWRGSALPGGTLA